MTSHRAPTRRRLILSVVVPLVLVLAALAAGAWWAHSEGYIPGLSQGCTDEGYPDPPPSYEDLVNEYGKDPYCARAVRDETWF